MKNQFLLSILLIFGAMPSQLNAQVGDEEDYSQYEKYTTDEKIKRYCTPKIIGLTPAKLVSIGYDFALGHRINSSGIGAVPAQEGQVNNYNGIALGLNIPLISNNKILINVGGNYVESNYSFGNDSLFNPLLTSASRGLKALQLNTTIFKPLNEKNFLLGFVQGDYSGDYTFKNMQSLSFTKLTWVAVFGWKFHERYQLGFGATQTYRAGGKSFLPVVMYNYTSKNEKWGIEALLPARGHFRYGFSKRTLLLAGFEIVGSSYHLANSDNLFPSNGSAGMEADYDNQKIELRRSEIRPRLDFQQAITDFIWVGVQAGYIVNYNFNVDSGNFYRGFGSSRPFVMENSVTSAPYFQISLNLVSP
ncbi:MAG: hypothetical protein RL264_1203 [Bacteroidota bacterium]|jgi:hypothetical protein